ncbi:hypothetical protein [Alkalihalobacterium chitinilyticum]|uniref:Uncharacterized protein n=1 Tax=Alkalihalobacterium chitinilyticum TaxID=2980103 RepID=A0ABT5VD78_9BACI|nr:hypothetical protein [Alkalihalobacterium chitinilyticum]MDE5413407.1 hypothetical protein [Alkalihalobacterium chitinilyticum]
MKKSETPTIHLKEEQKTVNPIQKIVSDLIKKGIDASIVQKPPRLQV